jgi:hypothetical protein
LLFPRFLLSLIVISYSASKKQSRSQSKLISLANEKDVVGQSTSMSLANQNQFRIFRNGNRILETKSLA